MNEKYIEQILQSHRLNRHRWIAAWVIVGEAERNVIRNTYDKLTTPEVIAYLGSFGSIISMVAKSAIVCLLTYPDCDYMMESGLDELKLLYNLGDKRAFMLYPACRILKETE